MARDDWFRRKTWSAEDQADFFARLKRARASSRAQYLRIQASHLQEAGTPDLLRAAIALLDALLVGTPERFELAMAWSQRAGCLAALGEHDEALAAYRRSFAAERDYPNVKTNAYLTFGALVVALQRTELYDEVLSVLEEFGGDEVFPVHQYQVFAARALISELRGDAEHARECARLAIEAATKTESPFRYHRTLGLVRSQEPGIEARLRRLAAAR